MAIPADLMRMMRKRAFLPATDYEAGGIGVSRDEGFAPDLDDGGGLVDEVARKPLVAQSSAATVSGDDNDERGGILEELSQGIDVEERAVLNDPRAKADNTERMLRSDRQSNLFLQSAGLAPLTPRKSNSYADERDGMRDWLMRRSGVAKGQQGVSIDAKRYFDAQDAAKRREATDKERYDAERADAAERETYRRGRDATEDAFRERELKRREDEAKRRAAPKPAPKPGGISKDATALRKEFNSLPEVRSFKETVTSYEKIRRAAQSPSAAGDMSLIFAFMKVLDPGSTVREGEFAAAQAAAGGDQRILSALEQVRSGQRLTEAQRRDFVSQAERLFASQRVNYDKARSMYRGLAEEAKANPDHVTGPDEGDSKPAEKTSGKVLVTNGTESLEIDADDLEAAERDGYRRAP